nr:RecName: Full=Fibrinogen alpha chain; Contains: RecName: Full=Fibrinopeptide A [Syncerus caffer]
EDGSGEFLAEGGGVR